MKDHSLQALIDEARQWLTLIGPKVSATDDEDFSVRKCSICNPPPPVYTCFICQFATEDKWRYKLHMDLNPKYCQEYGRRWSNRYAKGPTGPTPVPLED